MRIGILGGSYNPPHNGHIRAAQKAILQLHLDRLYVIPAAEPPHKDIAKGATAAQRLQMTKLAFKGISRAVVSDMEIVRGGKSFTIDTVRALQHKHPGDEIFLIMGGDMLAILERWREAKALMENCIIIVFQRRDDFACMKAQACLLREKYHADIRIFEGDYIEVSSTDVRNALMQGGDITKLIPISTADYILRNKLYGM